MERLQTSEARHRITTLVEAYDYDSVEEVSGISVHERVKPVDKKDMYRGAEYLFGTVLGESWADIQQGGAPSEFWDDSKTFLEKHGYELVKDAPREDDIVGYAVQHLGELYPTSQEVVNMVAERRRYPYFEHFGILTADRRVISKFSTGHVFIHDIDKIPNGAVKSILSMCKFGFNISIKTVIFEPICLV